MIIWSLINCQVNHLVHKLFPQVIQHLSNNYKRHVIILEKIMKCMQPDLQDALGQISQWVNIASCMQYDMPFGL